MQPFSPASMQTAARNPGVTRNLSGMDLSNYLSTESRGDGGLNIQFYYAQVPVKGRSGIIRTEVRLHIAKQPKGDKFTIATRRITEEQAMREFPHEFSQFKRYQEVPTNGTPLHELPGISQSQIAMLTVNGLRSVEDLAGLSADVVAQVGMEATHAHKLAKLWIAKKAGEEGTIRLAQIEAEREAEAADARARMEQMEAHNLSLQRQVEALIARLGNAPGLPEGIATTGPVEVDTSQGLPAFADIGGYADEGPVSVDGLSDLIDPLKD
jgi:hypothetical protein